MARTDANVNQFVDELERHLSRENPVLVEVMQRFRELDRIAHRMGLLPRGRSYAMRISWWPLVSVLGTFSAGKSSFINYYLGENLQRTGNQAVDDKFTVISHSTGESRVLPGSSLDADIRFPFFQLSEAIEHVAPGEGPRIDNYVQLKTSSSARLEGRILIDSPGFDADRQRSATLRITEHIIDLSDLVLVFFDARHPEPGAMRDTLEHLVGKIKARPDSGKFLFVLNQMDTTARDNNPEEVVAAWQRALAEVGYTTSEFFCIYNPDVAFPIEDADVRGQYEAKRDRGLAEIDRRIRGVDVARSYRIVRTLENVASHLAFELAPRLQRAVASWRRLVAVFDVVFLLAVAALIFGLRGRLAQWTGLEPSWFQDFVANDLLFWGTLVAVLLVLLAVQSQLRKVAARIVRRGLTTAKDADGAGDLPAAFDRSTRATRSFLRTRPLGWSRGNEERVESMRHGTNDLMQKLNDHYAAPG